MLLCVIYWLSSASVISRGSEVKNRIFILYLDAVMQPKPCVESNSPV